MHKQFFILIGRSGSGKGTQAELLVKKLQADGVVDIVNLTTGGGFRKFIEGDTYAAKRSRDLTNSGALNPSFLAIWNWANLLTQNLREDTTVILDGAPRKITEVHALFGALTFFGYKDIRVVYLDVSETWAMSRLTERGREDDKERADMERKMAWFAEDVLPCVEWYMHDERVKFSRINGEQSVEEVHQELVTKVLG